MKTKTAFLKGLAAIIATGTILATPLAAEEVTLRGVSCFPIGAPPGVPFENLVTEINEKGKGIVQIDLLGGAPAIGSPFQVVERMAQGAYDIAGCPEAFFGNIIPEAPALRLQEKTFAELRENGGIDYFQEISNKKNVQFIGRHHDDGAFNLFLAEGKAMYDAYSAVDEGWIAVWDAVLAQKKPRQMFVQPHTALEGDDVMLRTFEASRALSQPSLKLQCS